VYDVLDPKAMEQEKVLVQDQKQDAEAGEKIFDFYEQIDIGLNQGVHERVELLGALAQQGQSENRIGETANYYAEGGEQESRRVPVHVIASAWIGPASPAAAGPEKTIHDCAQDSRAPLSSSALVNSRSGRCGVFADLTVVLHLQATRMCVLRAGNMPKYYKLLV
jgi:hypothetical protein